MKALVGKTNLGSGYSGSIKNLAVFWATVTLVMAVSSDALHCLPAKSTIKSTPFIISLVNEFKKVSSNEIPIRDD